MVERIFAEQTLAACFIEGDQPRDQLARRQGLRECDRFLVNDFACLGMNGYVRQPKLFGAALITQAEIDAFCSSQVRSQTCNEKVVFGRHCALDAASRRKSVLAHTQAFLRRTFQK